eukprot:TRINITY_DN30807_c0_g1_i1.p1 TRINITY_DN30807_c0_g1~~TRINITY_DN30807_c0_g1_i1.p1  ORF type:complete len:284 (+),score=-1.23 TRINITY_DN30807_c0_g1_i1:77-928(+)
MVLLIAGLRIQQFKHGMKKMSMCWILKRETGQQQIHGLTIMELYGHALDIHCMKIGIMNNGYSLEGQKPPREEQNRRFLQILRLLMVRLNILMYRHGMIQMNYLMLLPQKVGLMQGLNMKIQQQVTPIMNRSDFMVNFLVVFSAIIVTCTILFLLQYYCFSKGLTPRFVAKEMDSEYLFRDADNPSTNFSYFYRIDGKPLSDELVRNMEKELNAKAGELTIFDKTIHFTILYGKGQSGIIVVTSIRSDNVKGNLSKRRVFKEVCLWLKNFLPEIINSEVKAER